jgi:hypothetical protein
MTQVIRLLGSTSLLPTHPMAWDRIPMTHWNPATGLWLTRCLEHIQWVHRDRHDTLNRLVRILERPVVNINKVCPELARIS